jgi:hypothetical protein
LEKVTRELNVGFRLHKTRILSHVFFCNYFVTKDVKSFIYDYGLRYLDAKKKKHKKEDEDEIPNFPGHEQIKFGDVVQAPPKLMPPKVSLSLSLTHSLIFIFNKSWANLLFECEIF